MSFTIVFTIPPIANCRERTIDHCLDDQSIALITESHPLYVLGTPSVGREQTFMIAIKPERLLELTIERWLVGRLSLTLSVGHTPGLRRDLLHPSLLRMLL